MPDSSLKSRTPSPAPPPAAPDRGQRNRMLLAVFLLLIAVTVVLVKDRGSVLSEDEDESTGAPLGMVAQDSDASEAANLESVQPTPATVPEAPTRVETPALSAPVGRVAAPKPVPVTKAKMSRPAQTLARSKRPQTAPVSGAPAVSATRAVLPPLRVEVVAGDSHRVVHPGTNSMTVDLQPGSASLIQQESESSAENKAMDAAPIEGSSQQVHMTADSNLAVTHKVSPTYPALARQMKVQGAVVLDALIGKDGGIQDLHVVQGPTILADAAREAVRQWRFKPFYQDGQPVETQAHITVNFQISTN